MGGGGTLTSASNKTAIKEHNIAAAMAHHPIYNFFEDISLFGNWNPFFGNWNPFPTVGYPIIPTFITTGTDDNICSFKQVYEHFLNIPSSNKVLVNLTGADHYEPNEYNCKYITYQSSFFNCWIKQIQADCDIIYSIKKGCSLCN
jgi:fermentation-respiration switch protein FrsA (DUF1100 family)